jgi:hypothetical protein
MPIASILSEKGNCLLGACLTAAILSMWAWPDPLPAQAASPRPDKSFVLYWDNDFFAGTDRDYTNGLRLTHSQAVREDNGGGENPLNRWGRPLLNRLPLVGRPAAEKALSLSLGQNIYTPRSTQRSDLIENDRPYAGYLYLGIGFHGREGNRRTVWEVDVGVVGPASLAEELQGTVHRITGTPLAEGWEHQLDNEPALEIIFETKWRLWHRPWGELEFDVIPHLGGRVGNVFIYASTGAEIRLGWSLPGDFGTCPIRPGCEVTDGIADDPRVDSWGFHFFTGVDGRAVLRDIFLDGSTFSDSHRVSSKPLVADIMAGCAVNYKNYRLSYAYVLRTKEFDEMEDSNQIFSTLSFSVVF